MSSGERTLTRLAGESGTGPQRAAIERQEHAANVLRWRTVTRLGAWMWPAFAVVDWWVDAFLQPGVLPYLLMVRAGGMVAFVASFILLHRREPPSPARLRWIDYGLCAGAGYALALMTIGFGGITSPYYVGIFPVIVTRGALLIDPWRRALPSTLVLVSAFPIVNLAAGIVAESWQGLDDPSRLGLFVLECTFLVAIGVIAVLASHTAWTMRRQVFEARNVGRYQLERPIGSGGMGEVWAAYHPGLKRDIAVKLLRPGPGVPPQAIERFEREVAATAQLTHPNTIRVFDYGVTDDGIWYYAMELLRGADLRTVVEREGALAPERAVYVLSQACHALAEAHARGIHHRDIKPENIFLATDGRYEDFVKVLDFGIARVTKEESGDPKLTRTGAVLGTPHFISPEGAVGKAADARADVYSLGAVLFYMLAGRPPFESSSIVEVLLAHAGTEAPRLDAESKARAPEDVRRILDRCLAKEPDARYRDAAELALALEGCSVYGRWRPRPCSDAPPAARAPRTIDPEATTLAGAPGLDATAAAHDAAPEAADGKR